MKKNLYAMRILALDLRSQRFGFAVLEGRTLLVEWGMRTYAGADKKVLAETVRKRLAPILAFFIPSAVVIKRVAPRLQSKRHRYEIVLEAVTAEVEHHAMPWSIVERTEVQRAFGKSSNTKKHEIASRVALLFPELTWKLPPERKFYESEHPGMIVFDAISIALTYLARFEHIVPAESQGTKPQPPG